MNRKLSITFAAALLSAPLFAGTASGAVDPDCVPTEAVTEIVEISPAVEAVYNLVWHQYTGKFDGEGAPSLDDENWKASPALPNGEPHQGQAPGVPYNVSNNDNGKGSWFLYLNVEVTPAKDAVTKVRIITPAVECPAPVETPEPELPPVDEGCPDVIDINNPNIGVAVGIGDCPVTAPKPGDIGTGVSIDPKGDIGTGVSRPREVNELPHTGNDDAVYIALAGLGLIGLGYIAYTFGRRS